MIQKIRMQMMTMKLQRRRKTNYCWGEKIHQSQKRRKLESRRIPTKTQRKRKRKATRGTLSYICSQKHLSGVQQCSVPAQRFRFEGMFSYWDFHSSRPMKVRHIVKMMCTAFRSWRIYWSHHFNSTCALNSGLKEGCATQSKERSCS